MNGPGAAAAFLDRDGVIVEPVHDPVDGRPEAPSHARDVTLARGAIDGLRRLGDAGFVLAVVSNQGAAAKGKVTLAELEGVHERTVELLAAHGITIPAWRYCYHHPSGTDPLLTRECACRKPHPGMLLDIAREFGVDLTASWMIGDSDDDIAAGHAAGCRTILVEHPLSAHRRSDRVAAELSAGDLDEAATLLLGHSGVSL